METGSNVCLKCVRTRLAVVLRPGPLGELKRSPRPSSRNEGPTSKGKGREKKGGTGRESRKGKEGDRGKEGEGEEGRKGRKGEGREGRGGKGKEGLSSVRKNYGYGPGA